jgi:hypothetical protein
MRVETLHAAIYEVRSIQGALGARASRRVGPIVVSGMLADQLARELAAAAEGGSVLVGGGIEPGGAEVAVHVIAGEPTDADSSYVDAADALGIPVVLVQLWPQADWTPPFVLSPFVVECRAGEGFPVQEIAARIAEAVEHAPALAARAPALRAAVERRLVREAVSRTAVLGALGARSRLLITLEQIGLLTRLGAAAGGPEPHGSRAKAAVAAGALASGLAFRVAVHGRSGLGARVVGAAAAAAGTLALVEARRRARGGLEA